MVSTEIPLLPEYFKAKEGKYDGNSIARDNAGFLEQRLAGFQLAASKRKAEGHKVGRRYPRKGGIVGGEEQTEKEKRKGEEGDGGSGAGLQGGTIEVRRTARRRRYCAPHPNAATPLIIVAGALPTPPLANDKYSLIPGHCQLPEARELFRAQQHSASGNLYGPDDTNDANVL